MSVNWFTVAAQIVNFLILVWLLKKFLYKPVLTAMDKRQKKVRAELEKRSCNRHDRMPRNYGINFSSRLRQRRRRLMFAGKWN